MILTYPIGAFVFVVAIILVAIMVATFLDRNGPDK